MLKDLVENPKKAFVDLNAGVVSIEEINYSSAGWTALMYLCRNAKTGTMEYELIQKLLDMGADPNILGLAGSTALMMACLNLEDGAEKIVELLLKHPKIDVNQKDYDGHSAVRLAVDYSSKNKKMRDMLMKDARINMNDIQLYSYSHAVQAELMEMYFSHPTTTSIVTITAKDITKMSADQRTSLCEFIKQGTAKITYAKN